MSRNTKIMLISGLIIFTLFLFITSVPKVGLQTTPNNNDRYPENNQTPQGQRYPYQELYHKYSERTKDYRFLLVEDLDKSSKVDTYLWKSRLQHGYLTRSVNGKYSFELAEEREIQTTFSEGGRSLELSDICNFNGKLYTFDDRTGLVWIITENGAYVSTILMDGDGTINKGFKGEWCTVKNDKLYIGGMGKEWTDEVGTYVNDYPFWVKTIDLHGRVEHLNWRSYYEEMRKATGTKSPGYLLHEAIMWHPTTSNWMIFPRRLSHEKYDAVLDEYRCSNTLISSNENFSSLRVRSDIGVLTKTRGFSSAKFIPYRENEIVLLKTEEFNGVKTYMMIINLETSEILLPETLVGNTKFEGIEFI